MVTFLSLLAGCLIFDGRDTVRITKVQGHADEGVVLDGRVRELVTVVLPVILWCGLLVLCLKGDDWSMLFVI